MKGQDDRDPRTDDAVRAERVPEQLDVNTVEDEVEVAGGSAVRVACGVLTASEVLTPRGTRQRRIGSHRLRGHYADRPGGHTAATKHLECDPHSL